MLFAGGSVLLFVSPEDDDDNDNDDDGNDDRCVAVMLPVGAGRSVKRKTGACGVYSSRAPFLMS